MALYRHTVESDFFSRPNKQQLGAAASLMAETATAMKLPSSEIDIEVLARLGGRDTRVYSAGISTAGLFEVAAVRQNPSRQVIATSIDVDGLAFTRDRIAAANAMFPMETLEPRIDVLYEDFSQALSPPPGSIDVVYSRLALHYLEPGARLEALQNLAKLTRPGGAVAIAVRSIENLETNPRLKSWDRTTGRAEIYRPDGSILIQVRYLPSAGELQADFENAGLSLVGNVAKRVETTFEDYQRSINGGSSHVLFAIVRRPT